MYLLMLIALLLLLPIGSVIAEALLHPHAASVMTLVGKWFVFWAVGIRLLLAGIRQVIQPAFTASEIFGIEDGRSFAIVREVGFANLSMGLLGVCSLFRPEWIVPAAIVGGLYYGLAGLGHAFSARKSGKEYIAMLSDGFVFAVLLAFVCSRLF
jgi:hypothetical protein